MSSANNTQLVEVYAGNIIEAGMVQSVLESAGIPAFLKNEIMGTLVPFYSTPGGAGSVKVLINQLDEAAGREVVAGYEANLSKE